MHRFYLPPEQCQQQSLFLTGREAHHAQRVVRVQRGEQVEVLDGVGNELLCEVCDFDRDKVRLILLEKRPQPPAPGKITLLQAVPKGKGMDTIVQKATELGASRIVPLLTERVITQLSKRDAAHKTAKWRQVAIEAIKQCGSAWLPSVEEPATPEQFLERKEAFELPLIASLETGSRSPRDYFSAFRAQRGRLPESVCVWIGPEGDFTPAETQAIKAHGVQPITLGRLILRTETAAMYCLSVLSYELAAT